MAGQDTMGFLSKIYFDPTIIGPLHLYPKKAKLFYWFEPYERDTFYS